MSPSGWQSLPSCHGRFCVTVDSNNSLLPPTAENCSNLQNFVNESYDPSSQSIMLGCCAIYCDEKKVNTNLLLALQCQGATQAAGIAIWMGTVVVVLSGFLHLLGGMSERGTRKFTAMGALALNVALTYFVLLFSTENADTILYPIVAAMDIAIFSYFFSGFQYGIGLVYEAGPVVLLSVSAFPLYRSITFPKLLGDDPPENVARAKAISMLVLTIVWALHSAIYRTITYRALWIQAWKKQTRGKLEESELNQTRSHEHHMSRLWFLAAGRNQPTWHTTVGQSVGLLNLILAWTIVIECNKFLSTTCRDDYVLFQIMLYVPPVMLTLAVISTNIQFLRFALMDSGLISLEGSQVYGFSESLKKCLTLQNRLSADCVIEATLAYRLGRNNLHVEPRLNLFESKFDRCVGHIVCKLQFGLLSLFYIPDVIIMSSHQCLLWIWISISTCLHSKVKPKEELQKWLTKNKPSKKEKHRAYEILVRYCGVDGVPTYEETNMAPEEHIRDILRDHQKHINLPLVLGEIGPSALLYLLILLDEVLEQN